MAPWAAFVPDITNYVVDCPHFTIEEAARTAAIDFFQWSRVWRATTVVTLATTVANQAAYTVTPPAGAELAGLPVAWLNGKEIKEARAGRQYDYKPGETGTTHEVLVTGGTTILLIPPTVTAGLVLTGFPAYQPTEAATTLDDALFHSYKRTIRELALSYLKAMQGKPWSDPAAATGHMKAYMAASGYEGMNAGPVRRNRLRTKKAAI